MGIYQPGEFIFQCPIFLPFYTVLEVLKPSGLLFSSPVDHICQTSPPRPVCLCKLIQLNSKLILSTSQNQVFVSFRMSLSWLSISCVGLFPVLFILNKFWLSFNAQFKFCFFAALFTPYSELLNYLSVPLAFDNLFLFMRLFFCNCFLPHRQDTCYYLVCPLFALILQILKKDFNGRKNKIIRNAVILKVLCKW